MLNLVELVEDDHTPAPCRHGNIIPGHACYCHSPDPRAPRKCPIWRNHGTQDLSKWRNGPKEEGACPLFEPTTPAP